MSQASLFLWKENAVTLMADFGEVTCRGLFRVRDKLEMIRLGRPLQRCIILNELAREAVHDIPCLDPLGDAAPAEMIGDYGRRGGTTCEKVGKTEEVSKCQIFHVDSSFTFARMNIHGVGGDWDRPEHTVGCQTRIKIMDLI
jgi:hypothetical protein